MSEKEMRRIVDECRLLAMRDRRQEMIDDLIKNRKFNPKAAPTAVGNFLKTLQFVLDETGSLPAR